MNRKTIRSASTVVLGLVGLGIAGAFFQNCSGGFRSASDEATYSTAASNATSTPTTAGAVGTTSTGGVTGNCVGGAPTGVTVTGLSPSPAFLSQYGAVANFSESSGMETFVEILAGTSCIARSTTSICNAGTTLTCVNGVAQSGYFLAARVLCDPTASATTCSSLTVGHTYDLSVTATADSLGIGLDYFHNPCTTGSTTTTTVYASGTNGDTGTVTVMGFQGVGLGQTITLKFTNVVLFAANATPPSVTVNGTFTAAMQNSKSCQ